MRRNNVLVVCAASVGGALAVAAAAGGVVVTRAGGSSLTGATALSLLLVLGAGIAAIVRPRHTEILTVATVVVAMALISQLYGRIGPLYTPALILMAVGIGRSDDAEIRRRTTVATPRSGMLATERERASRLSEQERTILQPRLRPPARRAG